MLADNAKTIVLERRGIHRFNPHLLDVAKHYGATIRLAAPYRAQTKGKVERFHRYLRESFLVPLQTAQEALVDVATANREVRIWLDEIANPRIHATLRERPIDRFAFERADLQPLPFPYGGRCERLSLGTMATQLPQVADEAARKQLSFLKFFEALLQAEYQQRQERTRALLTRTAGFSSIKTLEQYDFEFATVAPKQLINELAGLAFVERAQNVCCSALPESARLTWRSAWATRPRSSNQDALRFGGGSLDRLDDGSPTRTAQAIPASWDPIAEVAHH